MNTFPQARNVQAESTRRGWLLILALRSNPKLFCTVRGAVERLAETLGFPAPQCRSITRAVDEALTNIARHSYNNRLDQPVIAYFRCTEREDHGEAQLGLEILICDRGPAVDPSKLRGRPLEEIKPGGLGLHFIRESMDTVEFFRKGRTNRMRLIKYLAKTNHTP